VTPESSPLHPVRVRYRHHADRVALRTFMPRFPDPLEFEGNGSGWVLELDMPPESRIEYLIEVERDGTSLWQLDPANPLTASNPFGTNSVLLGPGWRRIDWMRRPRERGTLIDLRIASHALSERRQHLLYTPPQLAEDEPAPLLIVHDGADYVYHAGLLRCLDALIARGRIEPIRVVGLNPRRRHVHYIGNDDHAAHVIDEVLPLVAARVPDDGRMAVMGASLGAVASWHVAWRHPDRFVGAFLQSGTFAFDTHPELTNRMHTTINAFVAAAVEDDPLPAMRVMQTCGRYESLIDWNRRVAERFATGSADHRYVETWSGHDWGAWSATLVEGLTHLFGTEGVG
jgi:enterochelin esterase-like enzyme